MLGIRQFQRTRVEIYGRMAGYVFSDPIFFYRTIWYNARSQENATLPNSRTDYIQLKLLQIIDVEGYNTQT